ncbi:MAG: hypothetical protein R2843_00865 [Thermomicrobiales bacterium]
MTIGETGQTIRRWWWLLLLLPLIGLVSGFVMTRDQQYESSFRATILIPGDTEIPGSAERPELMVMDDAPSLIESRAFAEMTWAALPDDAQAVLAVEDVQDALSATRYSRVLTVVASREDPAQAEAIAAAVASVLPHAVNQYLVANSMSIRHRSGHRSAGSGQQGHNGSLRKVLRRRPPQPWSLRLSSR